MVSLGRAHLSDWLLYIQIKYLTHLYKRLCEKGCLKWKPKLSFITSLVKSMTGVAFSPLGNRPHTFKSLPGHLYCSAWRLIISKYCPVLPGTLLYMLSKHWLLGCRSARGCLLLIGWESRGAGSLWQWNRHKSRVWVQDQAHRQQERAPIETEQEKTSREVEAEDSSLGSVCSFSLFH